MANYNTLKGAIEQVIKTNGNNEITGALLQQSLLAMINSLGAGYQFAGVAVPATNPGTPDYNVFYFAGPGTYPNFNNATIPARNVGLLSYNGTWQVSSVQTTPFSAESIVNDIIQLYDGSTPVYPRTRAEAVFFDNDTSKTLDQQFSQLGQKVNGGFVCDEMQTFINSNGTYANGANDKSYIIPVSAGDTVVLSSNSSSSNYAYYSLVSTYPVLGSTAAFLSGTTRTLYRNGATFTVPENCYLVVTDAHSSDSELCKDIVINGSSIKAIGINAVNERVDEVNERVDEVNERVDEVNERVDEVDERVDGVRVVIGDLGSYSNAGTFVLTNYLKTGVHYNVYFESFDTTNIVGENMDKLFFRVGLRVGSTSDYVYYASRQGLGVNYAGKTVYDVFIEDGYSEIFMQCRGRNIVIVIYEAKKNLSSPVINEINELDSLSRPLISNGVEIRSVFWTEENVIRPANQTFLVLPVKQGDNIKIQGSNNVIAAERRFILCKNNPKVGETILFMNGEDYNSYSINAKTEKVVPEDGFLFVNVTATEKMLGYKEFLTWLQINNEIYVPTVKELVERLQESGGITDSELDPTSTNPVQNKVLAPKIIANKMCSDNGMFELESNWWILNKYLEDTYANSENSAVEVFKTKFRARRTSGVYQIAVISDTHGSGAYSWRNILRSSGDSCYRSIEVFNKIASFCDAAIHGGDLSCDYGTSRVRDLQYMYEIIRKFCFNKPFFITKGNHDENNNAYIEADMLNLDWASNTYYVRNFSTFTAVTEDTWNGSPIYISKNELVSDKEFRNMVQHWLSPSGATWGPGAYYYYDIDSVKIRFIVANSFPVDDSHAVSEDAEYLWVAQTAFNLSAKATPSDWKVIMLRHTQSTSLVNLSNLINALRTGGTWTYGTTTVDFSSINGGGVTFIAHIHGHEHQNCFSNGAGYFDIGENSAFVAFADLGDATKYGISVLSIDTVNGKVYEDTIGGKTWCYNYTTGRLEIAVGETVFVAESGLTRPVSASSSDTSIATCDGRTVTAVAVGDVTITVSDGTKNYDYLITVV